MFFWFQQCGATASMSTSSGYQDQLTFYPPVTNTLVLMEYTQQKISRICNNLLVYYIFPFVLVTLISLIFKLTH